MYVPPGQILRGETKTDPQNSEVDGARTRNLRIDSPVL